MNIAAGETLYRDSCRNCHGPTAMEMASLPRLAGCDHAYLTERFNAYRIGKRIGPNLGSMAPMALDLTNAEIGSLVAYIVRTFA